MSNIIQTPQITPEQKALIKNTVAKGATDDEFALFMHLAGTYDLDPFNKEIWFMKYGNGAATIFTSRDGYLKIANNHPEMDGLQSDTVCENDKLTKKPDGSIEHIYGNPRGELIGAYAMVYRKKRKVPVYVYASLKEYNNQSNQTWKKYTSAMILKVAEAMALKRAFSISGLVTKEEISESEEETPYQKAEVVETKISNKVENNRLSVQKFEEEAKSEPSQAEEPVLENPATARQKQQILLLINNQVFIEDEKAKMIAQLNKIDSDKADKFIGKLQKLIADRQKQPAQ